MNNTYTKYDIEAVPFDIIIDDTLHNLLTGEKIDPPNKSLLSILNDYESGTWRLEKFEEFIFNSMMETALSAKEKESLVGNPYSLLSKSAKNLRLIDGENAGGEIGEILLYGVMKKYYSALPVVPKIFYKQNTKDYAKGADSIHIVLEDDNDFSLWFGEAKFYNSLENSRLGSIIDSVSNMFDRDKMRKELNIVTDIKDIEYFVKDLVLLKKIQKSLSDGVSLDEIKRRLHIPIMLLHECEITSKYTEYTDAYKKVIRDIHIDIAKRFIEKQDKKLKELYLYDDIKFHLIIFPVPNKKEIVDRFTTKVKSFRA